MADDSSNSKYLDVANSQREFFSNYAEVFGAVASAVGGADPEPYSAIFIKVVSVIFQLGALFSEDPVESAINKLFQMLYDDFVALGAVEAASELKTRTTFQNGILADVSTAIQDIQLAKDHPELYPPGERIVWCQTALRKFLFSDDDIWNITYSAADVEKLYWTDFGRESDCWDGVSDRGFFATTADASYGWQGPPLNDDGITVFDYRVSLPLFLWVIAAFLAVGRSLDPNFVVEFQLDLNNAMDKLQSIYDKLMTAGNGLTPLSPPPWMETSLATMVCPSPTDFANGVRRTAVQLLYGPAYVHSGGVHPFPDVVGAVIEYGAVEKFSGINSIGDSYQINFQGDTQDPALFNKLQVRLLKRMKDVYVTTGLAAVWQTINQLKVLTGGLASNAPSFADWSVREVLAVAKLPAQSLRSLGAFMVTTQPFDTPYTDTFPNVAVSLRQLLTNVPH